MINIAPTKVGFFETFCYEKGIKKAKTKLKLRGLQQSKKYGIVKTLLPLMPDNRKQFWLDLPCCNENVIDMYTVNAGEDTEI